MTYTPPQDVVSPKAHWHLFDVVLDQGEGHGAYALGTWDNERRIGFRWNGSEQAGQLGNPQSRGLPTWTMLDPALHAAVVELLAPEKQVLARRFLGLRSPTDWRAVADDIRDFHRGRALAIAAGKAHIKSMGGATLVMHIVPLSAMDGSAPPSPAMLFGNPERFPPMHTARPNCSAIDDTGLVTGSNPKGIADAQRAYVHVSRAGIVEAVVSSLAGEDRSISLEKLTDYVVKYSRAYSIALDEGGISPPIATMVSLVGVGGMRLLQQSIAGALAVDIPQQTLTAPNIDFDTALFEIVPRTLDESARALRPLLNHLANAAGLPTSPFIDSDGRYLPRLRQGL